MKKTMIGTVLACVALATTGVMAKTYTQAGRTWHYELLDDEVEIVNTDTYSTAVSPEPSASFTIPSKLGTKTITSLGPGSFALCEKMTSVTIASSVLAIGEYAFAQCTALKSASLPANLMFLGDFAFEQCESLESITIPSLYLAEIGDSAFTCCYALKSVTIPASVKKIGADAFSFCWGITSLVIKDGVVEIGDGAFDSCYSLVNVSIPDSVTTIGVGAFQNCVSLKNVSLPAIFKGREDEIFYGCPADMVITFRGEVPNVNVTFNANGGKFSNGAATKTVTAKVGNLWGKQPMPSKSGQVFVGWYTEVSGGSRIHSSHKVPNASTTYYAHWTPRLGLAAASEWPLEFTTDSWCGQGAITHDGTDALRSGITYDNQNSYLQTTVTGAGTLTFWWAVSCESGKDALRFLVDGSQKYMISGEVGWTKVTVSITGTGTHTIKWNYTKNASVTKGLDFGFVDQISWTPTSSSIDVIFNANGGKFSNGAATKTSYNLTEGNLWGKMFMPAKDGQVFVGWYTAKSGGTLVTSSSKVPSYSTTYYAHWTPRLGLAAASEWSRSFTTDTWCGQGAVSHDGHDALRSGIIYDKQSSTLTTTVSGAGKLTFWWKVSCEDKKYDKLSFLVDSTQMDVITGETDWTQVVMSITGSGSHTLKWVYSKDSSKTKGQDFGWIDEITWTAK